MTITQISAVLLISEKAQALASFYRTALGIPFEDEQHDDTPLHYGCNIGPVHFAIHPAEGWPGERPGAGRSPVIALTTDDVNSDVARLREAGITIGDPQDHGFARVAAFFDPDGNHIELIEMK